MEGSAVRQADVPVVMAVQHNVTVGRVRADGGTGTADWLIPVPRSFTYCFRLPLPLSFFILLFSVLHLPSFVL
jgi:hypothetical protein